MTDTQAPSSYRWLVLANGVLVFTFAFGFGWTYIVMVVAQVLAELELEMTDWGMLWAAISFGTLVSAMIGGLLGDRYGVQKIVGLGVVLMGVTLVMRATASGFGSMYVWMFLFGVALALTFPNVPKALGMWFAPEEFGMANGVTQAGYGAGAALALALTPLVLEPVGGWRSLSIILGVATAVIGVLWFMTVRDRVHEPDEAEAEHLGTVAAIRQVLSIRDAWTLAACHMLFLGGYIGIIGYAPTYFVGRAGYDLGHGRGRRLGPYVGLCGRRAARAVHIGPGRAAQTFLCAVHVHRRGVHGTVRLCAGCVAVDRGPGCGAFSLGRPHWRSWYRWKWKAWVTAWPAPRWALPSPPAIWAACSPRS